MHNSESKLSSCFGPLRTSKPESTNEIIFTVLLFAQNGNEDLAAAASVCRQSLSNWELVVVSPPSGSRELNRELRTRIATNRVLALECRSLAEFLASRESKYVAFLEQDTIWHTERLAHDNAVLETSSAAVVFSLPLVWQTGPTDSAWAASYPFRPNSPVPGRLILELLLKRKWPYFNSDVISVRRPSFLNAMSNRDVTPTLALLRLFAAEHVYCSDKCVSERMEQPVLNKDDLAAATGELITSNNTLSEDALQCPNSFGIGEIQTGEATHDSEGEAWTSRMRLRSCTIALSKSSQADIRARPTIVKAIQMGDLVQQPGVHDQRGTSTWLTGIIRPHPAEGPSRSVANLAREPEKAVDRIAALSARKSDRPRPSRTAGRLVGFSQITRLLWSWCGGGGVFSSVPRVTASEGEPNLCMGTRLRTMHHCGLKATDMLGIISRSENIPGNLIRVGRGGVPNELGNLEFVDRRSATGWATVGGHGAQVRICIDGSEVATIEPSIDRPDVTACHGTMPRCGFHFNFPKSATAGQVVSAHFPSGSHLPGSPSPPIPYLSVGDLQAGPLKQPGTSAELSPIYTWLLEQFLVRHANDIRGRVLDASRARHIVALTGRLNWPTQDVVFAVQEDFNTNNPCMGKQSFDCAILDGQDLEAPTVETIISNLLELLKPGGAVLLPLPVNFAVSNSLSFRAPQALFTRESAWQLFNRSGFDPRKTLVDSFGNFRLALGIISGADPGDFDPLDLYARELAYPILLGVRAVKIGIGSPPNPEMF
jgi:hypothetical protein